MISITRYVYYHAIFSGLYTDGHICKQVIGIKSNFSQPFFIHWDVILGTRMTRADIAQRKKGLRKDKEE
jgi:sphinganine C4-monooxygenase